MFEDSKLIDKKIELEKKINAEDFWLDLENATNINKEYSVINKKIVAYEELLSDITTIDLLKDELNEEVLQKELSKILRKLNELETETHLNGEYDNLNCYLEIHPGAGGTESCDWAEMLFTMYQKYCEKNGFAYEIINVSRGEEAGIKSSTVLIKGLNAYGYLSRENGIHRLVRISPFDSNKRRHTSFASVKITPEFTDMKEIEINNQDLKIDVYHSSGAGGQSVNTSNSAVRITHLPSKIVVTCQNERSQLKNKETALKILKNKLYEQYLEEERRKKENLNTNTMNIDFGSQIRSYVLEPYKLVKDNRSNYESTDPENILNGDIKEMLDFNLKNIK